MSYLILPESGIPVSIIRVQRVTYLETCTDSNKQRFEIYAKAIKEIFHDKYAKEAFAGPNSTNLTMEIWTDLAEDDENGRNLQE